MEIVERGSGPPVTLFAPGGHGEDLHRRMRYVNRVTGTKVGFVYGGADHAKSLVGIRREADRDALEVQLFASAWRASHAVGFSRGARAIVGALAIDPKLFERVALVLPPGGHAAGDYATLLESPPFDLSPEFLVVSQKADTGHPVHVAERWAERLGAEVVILPKQSLAGDEGRVAPLLAEFLNQ